MNELAIDLDPPVVPDPSDDAELALLEGLYSAGKGDLDAVTQRRLAEESGLSLGMTNAIIKRCVAKGWILVRRINARNLRYALTPEGTNEIARRAYRYFRRTARSVSLYRDLVEAFVMARKREGYARLLLAGPSELDFLFEFACQRHGLTFAKSGDVERATRLAREGDVCLVSGEASNQDGATPLPNHFELREILAATRPAASGERGMVQEHPRTRQEE